MMLHWWEVFELKYICKICCPVLVEVFLSNLIHCLHLINKNIRNKDVLVGKLSWIYNSPPPLLSTITLNLIFMNKSSRCLTIVQWCAVILRTILATLSFCIYPKNSSGVLAGQQSWPGSDFAENCSLFRNKFNYSRAKLCQFLSKSWHEKSPNIWKNF